ncbi:hypothetical protein Zmor_005846 [Zophobas morio]|uniref:Uncharacterized protein n=1 Tax=Zophobas morio TaxID=2755281 RepID=A0AA38IW67_9CUCU|nr:hypothetical protein Zmor_005846 [Zophobas morio]
MAARLATNSKWSEMGPRVLNFHHFVRAILTFTCIADYSAIQRTTMLPELKFPAYFPLFLLPVSYTSSTARAKTTLSRPQNHSFDKPKIGPSDASLNNVGDFTT